MSYMDFSSWPREQEQSFVVYEQRSVESQKTAFTIGIVVAIAALVVAVGIFAGVEPEKKDLTKGMNMSNLTKSTKKSDAEATPAPAKAEQAPDPAPAAASDKPAEPSAK